MTIRFLGNKDHGYSATRGGYTVEVKQIGKRWEGNYTGDASLHNPIEPTRDGLRSIAGSGPKIVVGTDFRSRREAAEAALDAKKGEEDLWREARNSAAARLCGGPPSVGFCRQVYAELRGAETDGATPKRYPRRTVEQAANHGLMLACRRLDTAIASGDPTRGESARGAVVTYMADLLTEFGLLDVAKLLREQVEEFGHIEDGTYG